jgi:hypothetical protein
MIRRDDGRAMLPNSIAPGDSADVDIEMRTPPAAGRYVVEFDLVQEGVSWFKDKGSSILSIPAKIFSAEWDKPIPPADQDMRSSEVGEPGNDETKGSFEGFGMWCIPRAEVIRLLYDHHMHIEFLESSPCGGPGFQSYGYYARKSVIR